MNNQLDSHDPGPHPNSSQGRKRAVYYRQYRRMVAQRRRSENPAMRHVQSMIAEFEECDPWRKLAIAVFHMAIVDARHGLCKATCRQLATLADILGVPLDEGRIRQLVGVVGRNMGGYDVGMTTGAST